MNARRITNTAALLGLAMLAPVPACGGERRTVPWPSTPPTRNARVASAPSASAPGVPLPPPQQQKPAVEQLQRRAILEQLAFANSQDMRGERRLYEPEVAVAVLTADGWTVARGRDALQRLETETYNAFPDVRFALRRVFLRGNVAIVEGAFAGTHRGTLAGMKPNGKRTGARFVRIFTFGEGGAIARVETMYDETTLWANAGVLQAKVRPVPEVGASIAPPEPEWIVATGDPEEERLSRSFKNGWPAAWSKQDTAGYGDMITEGMVHESLWSPAAVEGRAANVAELAAFSKAIPDLNVIVDEVWAIAGYVVAKLTMTGTFTGAIGSHRPTKKTVALHGIEIDEHRGGKIARATTYLDGLELGAFVVGSRRFGR